MHQSEDLWPAHRTSSDPACHGAQGTSEDPSHPLESCLMAQSEPGAHHMHAMLFSTGNDGCQCLKGGEPNANKTRAYSPNIRRSIWLVVVVLDGGLSVIRKEGHWQGPICGRGE